MEPRLEDEWMDILGKAHRGLGFKHAEIASRAGIELDQWKALLAGHWDEAQVRSVAPCLGLNAEALVNLALNKWSPRARSVQGLQAFTAPHPVPGYEEMTVNAFVVFNPENKTAVLFDVPRVWEPIWDKIQSLGLELEAIFLTHTHSDHIDGLDGLLGHLDQKITVWTPKPEPIPGANLVENGQRWSVGGLEIEARLTPGHSPGGTTFVVEGLDTPVAMVGDALFAGSQGGVSAALYPEALQVNRAQILSLPEETILCPGHGPISTVGEEKCHNPFYA